MKNMQTKSYYLKSLLALPVAAAFWLITPVSGQNVGARDSVSPQEQQTMPPQDRDRDRDNDITHRELVEFDRFLDSHPEMAEQLRKDPSLVDNREFANNHPALQAYLQDHPHVSEEIRDNPNTFMHREDRYDRHEDGQGYRNDDHRNEDRRGDDRHAGDRRDDGITRKQLAEFDRFMDSHPETAEQLRKDPSLVDNREFVHNHPALQAYLQEHPHVSEEIRESPNTFMHREERYERHEDGYGRDARDHSGMDRGGMDHGGMSESAKFGEFLGGHSTIADQLSRDPSLIKNQEYMANHPDLQDYLKTHPAAQTELNDNPDSFVRSAQQFGTNNNNNVRVKNPALDSKPKQ